MVALICLATGSRWSEAQGLVPQRVRNGTVTFVNTKSKRARSIPISAELEQQLKAHFTAHGLFSNCLNSLDKALKASGLVLPAVRSSHVLRHTFAPHLIMSSGNILTLQKILGHISLAMTMRYVHLSPDHLQDAVRLGPVTGVEMALAAVLLGWVALIAQ